MGGILLEKLSAGERQTIAAGLFVVRNEFPEKGEQHGLCPFHDEANPSFSYNYKKNSFNCLSCGEKGDLVRLWGHVHGVAEADQFKDFCRQHNIQLHKSSSDAGTKREYTANPVKRQEQPSPVIPDDVWKQMKPLPPAMVTMLKQQRGWSEEAISKLDLRLQTVYLDKKDGSIKPCNMSGRIAMPVRDEHNKILYNVRLYKPGAKVNKITSWGPGYGSARLFPSGSTLSPTGPVFLCEGEPDTACAISHDLNAITQTSKTTSWPDDQKKQLKGRDVIICYDADLAGVEYAIKAAASLHGTAKSIRILEWPDYMGRQADGTWPDKRGQDLTDFFVTHCRTIDEFQELVAAARPYDPPPEPEDTKPAGGWQFFKQNKSTGRWSFVPRWLSDQILKDIPLMYDPVTSLLYKWNSKHWEEYHEDNLKKICINYLGDEAKMPRVNDSTAQAKLLSTIQHGRSPNDMTNWLCLDNTMLDISDLTGSNFVTKQHSKEFFSTYSLNVGLPNKLVDFPRWIKFLEETIQTPEVIMQAQEFAGYCLTRETRYGKCLFLLGPGSDGKSTFLKILQKLVGEQNSAAVSFRDMEDQFYRSALYNKLLNVSTEVGNKAMESMYFKAIVTGDRISAAFKNKTPFEFTPFCKLAFAANRLPRVLDNSDGFFRRVLPIGFKRQFFGQTEDKFLEEKLVSELDGIFQWAIVGLARLRDQKGFTQCKETDELLMDYKRENNPILCFVEEECVMGEGFKVQKDGLYAAYSKYCDRSGYNRVSRINFFRELTTVRRGLLPSRKRQEDGSMPRYLDGIGLKVEGES